jgi:hypothetical protein
MTRKLTLALAAAVALGAAALAPTTASAWHPHGHHHHHHWRGGFGIGFYGPTFVAGPDCYLVKRTFERRDGSIGVRYVRICD